MKHKQPYYNEASDKIFEYAKELRHSQTSAEKFLWQILRNRKIAGLKFGLFAGFIIGVTEGMAISYGLGMWRDMVSFGILIFILILRPKGLFGTIYEIVG